MMRRAPIPGILFLSDLPNDCKKSDILDIFLDFGPIEDVEIVKDDDFLHFARVTFKFVVDAMAAVDELNSGEELILDQPLKISWSSPYDVVPLYTPVSYAAVPFLSADDLRPPPVHVLFSFISCQVVEQISEQIIAESFIPFGILTDVNIKKHNTVTDGGYQNGFGFVQYEHSWGGIMSAIRAVRWFDKKYMGHMTVDAKFGQQFQHFLLKHGILTEDELLKLKKISRIKLEQEHQPRQQDGYHSNQQEPRMASMDNLFSLGATRKPANEGYGGRNYKNNNNNNNYNDDYPNNRANWPSSGRNGDTGGGGGGDSRYISSVFGYAQPPPRGGPRGGGGGGGGNNRYNNNQQRGHMGGRSNINDYDNNRGGYRNNQSQRGGFMSNYLDRSTSTPGLNPNIFFQNDPIPHPSHERGDLLPGDSLPGDNLASNLPRNESGKFPSFESNFGGGGWVDNGEM